jgi:phosphate starvation-inducible membrane PsiE
MSVRFFNIIVGIIFGVLLICIGIVNTFWGNDVGLGIGLILLSFLYFPFATNIIKQKTGIHIPVWVKIVLGLLLLWIVLGVGELFGKIELMLKDLS